MRTSPLPLIAGSRQGESRMRRLLSRTSITEDEAVSILLGQATGPIEFEPIDDDEEVNATCPTFCLQEALEDQLEVLDGEYRLAKHEKQPADVVSKKLSALQQQEAVIEQANVYLCAIRDELNKGEQSVLKVDSALSNAVYKYITLHSFNEWVQRTGRSASAEPENSKEKKPPRTKLLQQEDAILAEIRKQGFDPMALPPKPEGKSGVKAAVCLSLDSLPPFEAKTSFAKAWDRLRKDRRISE